VELDGLLDQVPQPDVRLVLQVHPVELDVLLVPQVLQLVAQLDLLGPQLVVQRAPRLHQVGLDALQVPQVLQAGPGSLLDQVLQLDAQPDLLGPQLVVQLVAQATPALSQDPLRALLRAQDQLIARHRYHRSLLLLRRLFKEML